MSEFEWIDASYEMVTHYAAMIGPFRADVYKSMDGRWKGQVVAGEVAANILRDNAPDAQMWCMNYCLKLLEGWTTRAKLMIYDFPLTYLQSREEEMT